MDESLSSLLLESIRKHWNREALSNYNGDTFSYGDIASSIAHLHLLYEKLGIERGDKIAICGKNQASWGIAFLSIITYGAVAVPLLHEFKPSSIHHLVNHSDSRILFIGDNLREDMEMERMRKLEYAISLKEFTPIYAAEKRVDVTKDSINRIFREKYPTFKADDISFFEDKPDDIAIINYTSGTTGFSKGVMIPYRALLSNIRFAAEVEPQMDCTSKVVSMLPSAHMYGMMFEFLFEMTIGAHVFFLTRLPSPAVIVSALKKVRPDIIITVPMVIEKIYKKIVLPQIERKETKLLLGTPILAQITRKKIRDSLYESLGGRFHEAIIGGAPLNREVESFFKSIGFPYTVGYGMTECGPIITYIPWTKTKVGACGKAAPRMEIKIDSSHPDEVPGEILLRGDNVFSGYYKNEKSTRDVLSDDGWFHTGDLGIIDRDGYLYIRGRSKTMILGSSGQNIYPEEIESVINNLPLVTESLVVENDGVLTALVHPDFEVAEALSLSGEPLKEEMMRQIRECNAEMPSYCKISDIRIMSEEFEKTPKKSIKRFLYQNR